MKDLYKIKYIIKRNHSDGTYEIFEKDPKGKLTFNSSHDTLIEAEGEVEHLETKPSMRETIQIMKGFADSLNPDKAPSFKISNNVRLQR